jgi:hypothetical protein
MTRMTGTVSVIPSQRITWIRSQDYYLQIILIALIHFLFYKSGKFPTSFVETKNSLQKCLKKNSILLYKLLFT